MERLKIKHIFTFLLIVYPIFGIYSVFVPQLSLADFFLILVIPLLLIKLIYENKYINNVICFELLIYLIWIILHLLIVVIFSSHVGFDVIWRTFKYCLYIFTLAFFVKEYFMFDFAITVICYIAVIATIYLFLQEILLRYQNYYLLIRLPLDFQTNAINEFMSRYSQGLYIRAHSFFSEPSHYATYIVAYLSLNLSKRDIKDFNLFTPILVTFGIFVSRSSTGIILAALLWLFYFFRVVKNLSCNENLKTFFLFILSVLPIVSVAFFYSDIYSFFALRTFGGNALGQATLNRIGNYEYMTELMKNNFLIGNGMIKLDVFLSGAMRLLVFWGLIGAFLFIIINIFVFKKSNYYQRIVLIVFYMLNIGSEAMFGNFIFIFLPFIICSMKGDVNEYQNRNNIYKLE